MTEMSAWVSEVGWSQAMVMGLTLLGGFAIYLVLSRGLRRMTRQNWMTPLMEGRARLLLRWFSTLVVGLLLLQQSGLVSQAWALLSGFFAVAAVSFVATWSVLSNGICAVMLLIYRPFSIGDTIEIFDASDKPGFRGTVLDINLLYTTLQSHEDRGHGQIQVPNNMVLQRVILRYQPQAVPEEGAS